MLVLSRRVDDRIVFPSVGINLQILRVRGSNVRIGIEAPPDLPVLRHELYEEKDLPKPSAEILDARQLRHCLRNGLNVAKIGFQLAIRQLDVGQIDMTRATLERALAEIHDQERKSLGAGVEGSHQPTCKQTDTSNKRRALLVEDNPNECELLAGYLRISGYQVETAKDGLEAMTRLATKQSRPDVVLLDMRMPRLDGPKMVSAIRGNPDYSGLRLFAVSGVSHEEANVRVGPRGVDGWFLKPVNPAELVDQLNRELTCEVLSA
jgi:carbon storage regulator CsrA